MNLELLVIIYVPVFTALIGWLTNKVAIKMLFRPRNPLNFIGFSWQGLIPRRQAEIAKSAGEIIERELLSSNFLREKIQAIDLVPHLRHFAARLIRDGIGERLKSLPLIGNFIDDTNLAKLEKLAADEMSRQAGSVTEAVAAELEKHLEISNYVEEQIQGFDLEKLEEVVNQVANKEFRTIELLGGVLGFAIGLAQLLLLWVTGNLNI